MHFLQKLQSVNSELKIRLVAKVELDLLDVVHVWLVLNLFLMKTVINKDSPVVLTFTFLINRPQYKNLFEALVVSKIDWPYQFVFSMFFNGVFKSLLELVSDIGVICVQFVKILLRRLVDSYLQPCCTHLFNNFVIISGIAMRL